MFIRKPSTIIIAGISKLANYIIELPKLQVCRDCPKCGISDSLHAHGSYYRKCNRHAESGKSLNPIKVLRFLCKFCHITCSPLPECIPPRRWYLWEVQQLVIQERLLGKSWRSISRKFKIARSTCRRWFQDLHDKFPMHADTLRNVPGKLAQHLVHCFDVKSFWQSCLTHIDFARAMFLCHNAGIKIP